MRRFLGLSVVVLGAFAAWAAPPLKLTVVAGAGGTLRPGAIAPVQVLVECPEDGDSYEGQVAARFTTGMGNSQTVHRQLALAPSSAKRTTLYLFVPESAQRIEVWYEMPNGRKIGDTLTEDVRLVDSTKPTFAAIGAFPPSLPPNQLRGAPLFFSVNLQPAQIPDRHEGLEMFDAVFLTPAPDLALRADQMEALAGWVMRGGTLVLDASARTDFFRSSRIDEISPFMPSGTAEATIDELGGTVLHAVGAPVPGAEVLLTIQDIPLVYRRNYGFGACVAFAIDPQAAGLRDWAGSRALWTNVLQDPRVNDAIETDPQQYMMGGYAESRDGSSQIAQAITQAVAPDAPSTGLRLGLVLLLTALYALAVGPGDYFLIKRLGKPKLTWITFPTIVAVFTLAAYGGARVWIGGEMNVRSSHRLVVFPQAGRAIHYEAAGLFVPQGATYAVSHEGSGLLRHLGEVMARDDRLVNDQAADVIHHRIPIWTFRTYVASNTETDYPDVELHVTTSGDRAEATVTNRTDTPLRQVNVSGPWASQEVGNIDPGQTVTIPLERKGINVRAGRSVFSGAYQLNNQYPSVMREFTADDAFARGAIMLDCMYGELPTTLRVDGDPRPETGPARLQVVAYPEPEPAVLEREL